MPTGEKITQQVLIDVQLKNQQITKQLADIQSQTDKVRDAFKNMKNETDEDKQKIEALALELNRLNQNAKGLEKQLKETTVAQKEQTQEIQHAATESKVLADVENMLKQRMSDLSDRIMTLRDAYFEAMTAEKGMLDEGENDNDKLERQHIIVEGLGKALHDLEKDYIKTTKAMAMEALEADNLTASVEKETQAEVKSTSAKKTHLMGGRMMTQMFGKMTPAIDMVSRALNPGMVSAEAAATMGITLIIAAIVALIGWCVKIIKNIYAYNEHVKVTNKTEREFYLALKRVVEGVKDAFFWIGSKLYQAILWVYTITKIYINTLFYLKDVIMTVIRALQQGVTAVLNLGSALSDLTDKYVKGVKDTWNQAAKDIPAAGQTFRKEYTKGAEFIANAKKNVKTPKTKKKKKKKKKDKKQKLSDEAKAYLAYQKTLGELEYNELISQLDDWEKAYLKYLQDSKKNWKDWLKARVAIHEEINAYEREADAIQKGYLHSVDVAVKDLEITLQDYEEKILESYKKNGAGALEYLDKVTKERKAQADKIVDDMRKDGFIVNEEQYKTILKTIGNAKLLETTLRAIRKEIYEEQRKQGLIEVAEEQAKWDEIQKLTKQAGDAIFDIWSKMYEKGVDSKKDELDKLDVLYKKGLVSLQEYSDRKDKINEEATKKQKKAAVQQALAQRGKIVFDSAMAIAQAWFKAFQTDPPKYATVEAIMATALLTAQSVAALAVPLPKAKKGGEVVGPTHERGGVAIEAEGGEYIVSAAAYQANKDLVKSINSGNFSNQFMIDTVKNNNQEMIDAIKQIQIVATVDSIESATKDYNYIKNLS